MSLGIKASEKSEHSLPVQCDHDKAIEREHATPLGRLIGEIDVFVNYLASEMKPRRMLTPVVTAVANYALFIWGVRAVSQ